MRDYLELGATPADEPCLSVGSATLDEMRAECRRYVELLKRKFPIPDGADAYFTVKTFNGHDYGAYPEAVVSFNERCEMGARFAYHVENNLPAFWTEEEVIPFVYVPEEVESY